MSNFVKYFHDTVINGGDQSKNPFVTRDTFNKQQTKDVYKFQRSYKLVVGVPKISRRYVQFDDLFPEFTNPESRRFVPNVSGGSYDITSTTDITPIDAEVIGAPYYLKSCIIEQKEDLGFRVTFTSNKNDSGNQNIERITVFNPPKEVVDMVNEPGAILKFYCGYLGDPATTDSLLMSGSIASSDFRDDGVDKVLTIDIGQLGSTYATRWIARQFSGNTKVVDIIEHLATYLVRNSIVLDQYSIDFPLPVTVGKEYPVFGDALSVLQKLTSSWGYYTFVTSGILYVKPATTLQGFESSKVIRLSEISGLIGRPQFIVDKKDQAAVTNQIRFKCLLDPNINLRTRIKLNSGVFNKDVDDPTWNFNEATIDMTVIVTSMVIKGDSFSGDWYNECIADIVKDTSIFPNTNDTVIPLAQNSLRIGS